MTFRVRETREENIGADFYPEAGTTAVAGCTRFIAVAAAAGLKAKEGDRKSDFDSLVHLVTQASRFGGERNGMFSLSERKGNGVAGRNGKRGREDEEEGGDGSENRSSNSVFTDGRRRGDAET